MAPSGVTACRYYGMGAGQGWDEREPGELAVPGQGTQNRAGTMRSWLCLGRGHRTGKEGTGGCREPRVLLQPGGEAR